MRTVAISALAHAAVVAAWWTYTPSRPPPPPPAPTVSLVEVSLPLPPPRSVAAPPAIARAVAPDVGSAPSRARRVSTEPAKAATGPTPAATEPATSAPTRALAMRQPGESERGRIALPAKMEWDPDMPAALERPPEDGEPTGKLRPDGGGTYRSNQGPFTAKVGKDGTVKLTDGKNLRVKFALPSPKQLGKMIADWYLDPNKPVGMLPPPDPEKFERDHQGGGGYGSEKSEDSGGGAGLPILAGGFDISDALLRGKGQDPYASKKLAFLDSTRAERVQIGMKYRSEQLSKVSELMQRNLERLWATVADPAERKAELFALWDEVEETGSEELVAAGLQARALVIGWIRAKLPAGSAGAYSASELAALAAKKTSKATFAPYD